jgi:hypothetical protein
MKPSFDSRTHTYSTGDRVVPSVTEILRAVGVYGSYEFAADVHRWRGTAVHQYCAITDLGGKPVLGPVAPQFQQVADDIVNGYGRAFEKFKDRTGWQGKTWEVCFVDPIRGYGGTQDTWGEMPNEPAAILLDLKSGMLPELVPVQLVLYELLVRHGVAVDEEHPGLEWLREVIKSGRPIKRMALRLEKSGKDTLYTATSKGESYDSPKWLAVANSVLNLYNLKTTYNLFDREPR